MSSRVALATLALLLAVQRGAAQTITASPGGDLSSLPGVAFDVPIVVNLTARPADRLGSFAARLTWNPAVLQFNTGLNGSFGSVTPSLDSLPQGIVRFAGANPAGVGGLVTLANVRFTPLVADTTTIGLTIAELYAAGTFADLLPSLTVSDGAFCPARGRFGDINTDGTANSFDALVALSAAVGLSTAPFDISLGDVDASGATNARDALIILSNAVGLDVSAFRVLRMAAGACGSGAAVTIAIAPAAPGTLEVGQVLRFEARGSVAGGGLQALPNVTWRSSNSDVLSVLATGVAVGRSPGAAIVTAVRDGRDSTQLAITVVGHRTLHVVDAAAEQTDNQIGTATLPFAHIGDAAQRARAGDTIEVRPGRYAESVRLAAAALLLGDTLVDGTRPVISVPPGGSAALTLEGSGARVVRNLGIDGGSFGVMVDGPDALLLDQVVVRGVETGIVVGAPMRSLVLRHTRMAGTGGDYGGEAPPVTPRRTGQFEYAYGAGIDAQDHSVDTLVVDSSQIGDFDGHGIRVADFDQLLVRGSVLHDVSDNAISAGDYGDSTATTGRDVVLLGNMFTRAAGGLLDLRGLRDVTLWRNTSVGSGYDLYEISAARTLRITGDTIGGADYGYWLNAYDLDSVIVDSVRADLGDRDGYLYNAGYLRITDSQFRNATDGVLDMYNSSGYYRTGGRAELTNVTVEGDPACYLCVWSFYFQNVRTTVDRLTVINASGGVEVDGDSALSVTRSTFTDTENPVQYYGNSVDSARGLTVTFSTFRRFQDEAISAFAGPVTVDSNTFVSGYNAIEIGGAQPQVVTRNRIVDVQYGIEVNGYDRSGQHVVSDNVLTGIVSRGLNIYGLTSPDTAFIRYTVARDSITCRPGPGSEGIRAYEAHFVITDNLVSGCTSGIQLTATTAVMRTDSIAGNTLVLPAGASDGIWVDGNWRSRITGNTITGDTTRPDAYAARAAISVGDESYNCTYYYTCHPVALVDSNVVAMVRRAGIRLAHGDSLVAAYNSVSGVSGGYGYYATGGVVVDGYLRYLAVVYGNTVRDVTAGAAILVQQYDTATVRVDSNQVSTSIVGVEAASGAALLTHNRITGNATDGVLVYYSGVVVAALNNISGNALFGLRDAGAAVAPTAVNNWWGDANGPRCVTGCDLSVAGDSVSTSVAFAPFLSAEDPGTPPVPPPAPPALRAALTAAAAVAAPRPRGPVARPAAPAVRAAGLATTGDSARVARRAQREQRVAARRAEHERRHAASSAAAARRTARPAPSVRP